MSLPGPDQTWDAAVGASRVTEPDGVWARGVVSYKLRRGRLSGSHRAALAEHAARYRIESGDAPLDFVALFGRVAPAILEIGSGMGETTLAMAGADPTRDVIAVEVHTPGIAALIRGAAEAGLRNLRVAEGDAVPLLRERIPDGALEEIRIFFPDPWPKKRHHKRRLVSPTLVHLAATKLTVGGHLWLATDWPDYARQMLAVIDAEPLLANTFRASSSGGLAPRPESRPVTRFEQQGIDKGHPVADIIAERRALAPGSVAQGSSGQIEVVAAAILDHLHTPTRLLAAQRSRPSEEAGRWELPGGKREPGESAEAALRRELAEELAVEVRLGSELVCPDSADGWPIQPGVVLRVWPAEVTAGDPMPLTEHSALRWLDLEDAPNAVPWLDADVPIVEHLIHMIAGSGGPDA